MSAVTASTVLIIEAERRTRDVMRSALRQEGYVTFEASSGPTASHLLRKQAPDLILMDLDSQKEDLPRLCRTMRLSFDGPLIVMSASDRERDKVLAFDAGADEYLVKPFGMLELVARIRVLLRRFGHSQAMIVETPDLCIDLEARLATVRGKTVYLTPKEFEVLKVLVLAKGKPVTHESLLQAVWGRSVNYPEIVRVAIHELRRKIERQSGKPQYIRTEHMIGYRFVLPAVPRTRFRRLGQKTHRRSVC